MKRCTAIVAVMFAITLAGSAAYAAPLVTLDGVTLDTEALDNGCATETLSAAEVEECRYRVCFSLLKSLWLSDEADRRNLEPDPEALERQQQDFEKSNMGEQLAFTVLPRLKFQSQVIELFRKNRTDNSEYSFDDLWKDVVSSATQFEIPERALRALVTTYGQDEQRFKEFQKMFPEDYETALARSRNSWEREARRVALEKAISPDDALTTAELEKAALEWKHELETAPEATDAMLRARKRQYNVHVYLHKQISENGKFEVPGFREGLLAWIQEKIINPDKQVFGKQ
jgi:hypothetical protein